MFANHKLDLLFISLEIESFTRQLVHYSIKHRRACRNRPVMFIAHPMLEAQGRSVVV